MRIATAQSAEPKTTQAIADAYASLTTKLGGHPDWLLVHSAVRHDADALRAALARVGARRFHASSSCLGVMTETGVDVQGGLGLFGLRDAEGNYGVGMAPLGTDPAAAARRALQQAIIGAEREGEVPALIWLSAAPGHEEACIRGLESLVGQGVPIVGGSAADDAVAGGWYLACDAGSEREGVLVTALYTTGGVYTAFHGGYAPTLSTGRVTQAEGRTIHAIDGKPAALVYDAWTGGTITDALAEGGTVLANTTLFPIGRRVGASEGVAYHRLAHPESVTPAGSLRLFADFDEGDELVLMQGTREALRQRAGRVAADALALARRDPDAIAGALVIFCAGCMLTVRDELDEVVASIRASLGEVPFLGGFTFGEQGCFVGGENRHGNLMISVTLFAKP